MDPRIEEIFLLARDTLNDHKEERYPDATLFRNLKTALKDISTQTGISENIRLHHMPIPGNPLPGLRDADYRVEVSGVSGGDNLCLHSAVLVGVTARVTDDEVKSVALSRQQGTAQASR